MKTVENPAYRIEKELFEIADSDSLLFHLLGLQLSIMPGASEP